MKILFFTESLTCGGKERRILELIKYLKQNDHTIALVLAEPIIHYEYAYDLGITIKIIQRRGIKYDPFLFKEFYNYCKIFKPDIIHTWGEMTTFYAIPTKLILGVPLVSSMIADSKRSYRYFSLKNLFFKMDILFADIILSNTNAGIKAYQLKTPKVKVIYNGVDLSRFEKDFSIIKTKEKFGINTRFVVVMVAKFSNFKDYDLFLDIAKEFYQNRTDVTFVGVGGGPNFENIRLRIVNEDIPNVILTGKQDNVENIIAASDIGLLCTYREGISNSIIEYMALGKPVIATDLFGGSREIIIDGETGYITDRECSRIVELVDLLLKDSELNNTMGKKGRERINSYFSITKMGQAFDVVYKDVLAKK